MRDEIRGDGFLLSVRRELPPGWQGRVPSEIMVEEALRLAEAAQARGIPLKLFGGVGVRLHCLHSPLVFSWGRDASGRGPSGDQVFGDLDFMSYWPHHRRVEEVFLSLAYLKRRPTLGDTQLRQIYYHPRGWFHVDVVYDHLTMNHDISFRGRLELDYPTVPVTDLLLTKLQIVRPSPKDLRDCALLLAAHPLAEGAREAIDPAYLEARLLASWGFWFTALQNLKAVSGVATELSGAREALVRVRALGDRLAGIRGGPGWKARALLGQRLRWYRLVDGAAAAHRGLWR